MTVTAACPVDASVAVSAIELRLRVEETLVVRSLTTLRRDLPRSLAVAVIFMGMVPVQVPFWAPQQPNPVGVE